MPVDTVSGNYVTARPHPALARHVLGYTGYREFSRGPVRRRQAPTGACTLILGLGPPLRLHGPAGPVGPQSFLAGMHDAAVLTEFTGAQHGLQIDLTPLGVFVLLGRPSSELANRTPALDELGIPALAGLPARLAADPDWPSRFTRLDRVLYRLVQRSPTRPDPEVAWAWHALVRTAGGMAVGELAKGSGWSRRHLLTRFRTQIGLGPKTAARVLRFRRAADLLVPRATVDTGPAHTRDQSIADVAADCGYADHAHLVREFHDLAGCSPSQYITEWQQ